MTQTEPLIHESSKPPLYQPDTDAIIVTPTYVSFSGVKVPRGEITDRDRVLDPVTESKGFIDDAFSLEFQQTIATSFSLSQPLLIEGGSSLGKTRTVKRMASLLGWEVHAISCSSQTEVDDLIGRMVPNPEYGVRPGEPEFIFLIGEIAKALIYEPGVRKLILLDEVNVIPGGVLTALHEIIDEYNKGGKIIIKKTGEVIKINPEAAQIVCCMNPPRGYAGREPLDRAQMRRYNYVNLGESHSIETVTHRTYDSWGLESESKNPALIENRDAPITREELNKIPNFKELIDKYLDFHFTVKKQLNEMKIGRDQAQKFIYDDAELTRKVREFILKFYNGNINETFQTALRFYYVSPLENEEDRKIVLELIKNVQIDIIKTDSRRRTIPGGGASSSRTPDTSPTTEADSPARKDVSPTPVASSEGWTKAEGGSDSDSTSYSEENDAYDKAEREDMSDEWDESDYGGSEESVSSADSRIKIEKIWGKRFSGYKYPASYDLEPGEPTNPINQGTFSEEWRIGAGGFIDFRSNFGSKEISDVMTIPYRVLRIDRTIEGGIVQNREAYIGGASQFLDVSLPANFKTKYGMNVVSDFFEVTHYSQMPEVVSDLLIYLNNMSTSTLLKDSKLNLMARILVRVNKETFKKMDVGRLRVVFLNLKNHPLVCAKFLGSLPNESVFVNNLLSNSKDLDLILFVLDTSNKEKLYDIYKTLYYGSIGIKAAPELILKYLDKFKGMKNRRGVELDLVQIAHDCIQRCKDGSLGLDSRRQLTAIGISIFQMSQFKDKFFKFDEIIKNP